MLEGAKCEINLTMLISSSSYPKNIYDMPLVEVGVQIQFEFECKFKFELKQKRKQKEKEKEKGPRPHGLASGEQGPSPSLWPRRTGPPNRDKRKQKRKKGPSP